MTNSLDDIEQRVPRRNFDNPPLQLWHPPLSGDIAIRIASDGSWYHEGAQITREALVRLFASILRREGDGEYYLVTPAEKWRIQVELHPLIVTDMLQADDTEPPLLKAVLNTGRVVVVGEEHPLSLEPAVGNIPFVRLQHGLTALLSRAAWYRLVDLARWEGGAAYICSGDYRFELAIDEIPLK